MDILESSATALTGSADTRAESTEITVRTNASETCSSQRKASSSCNCRLFVLGVFTGLARVCGRGGGFIGRGTIEHGRTGKRIGQGCAGSSGDDGLAHSTNSGRDRDAVTVISIEDPVRHGFADVSARALCDLSLKLQTVSKVELILAMTMCSTGCRREQQLPGHVKSALRRI